jgi:dTDP-4-dehydrorhamnose reductase
MRTLITGAAGMLGLDVAHAAEKDGDRTLALGRAELDITDTAALTARIAAERPELVINCAAWTDVDGAELNEPAALEINASAAGNLAAAAAAAGAWIVHVSSDYVFDGEARRPYVESDPTAPINAYGRTKLAGERAVAAAAPDSHTIVRSSWLFGTGGHCFPRTILRLARERTQLRVVQDQVGSPTFTGHLAVALLELGRRQVPGIVHVAGAGRCSWFGFAREIVRRAGEACEVVPCATEQFPRPAPRPGFSVLASERGALAPRLPDWRVGLDEFIAARVSAR